MLRNLHGYTPLARDEVSCVIAHLFAELAPPCSACKSGVITIQGTAYDGSGAKIEIDREEVRFYGQCSTLERIRKGQCTRPASERYGRNNKRPKTLDT